MVSLNSKRLTVKIFFYFLIIFSFVSYQKLASQNQGSILQKENNHAKKYKFTADWFSHNIPTWEKILDRFKGKPNIHYLEIGVFEGMSAFWMLENILTHSTSKLTCIDIFPKQIEERFYANLKKSGFEDRVTVVKGKSQKELKRFSDNSFDIIYIDGGHTAADVLADAVLSWPLLKEEGILIFDDYLWKKKENPPQMTPKIAIDAFITVYINHIEIIHHAYQVVLKKRKKSNSHFYHIQKYVYDWDQKKLYLSEKMEPIELSEAETTLIERLIKSRRFGKARYSPDNEMFNDKLFINLINRLKLDIGGEKIKRFRGKRKNKSSPCP
jgi:predicted O-methyltransferase YrrM